MSDEDKWVSTSGNVEELSLKDLDLEASDRALNSPEVQAAFKYQREAETEHSPVSDANGDGEWVTINGKHILIGPDGKEIKSNQGAEQPKTGSFMIKPISFGIGPSSGTKPVVNTRNSSPSRVSTSSPIIKPQFGEGVFVKKGAEIARRYFPHLAPEDVAYGLGAGKGSTVEFELGEYDKDNRFYMEIRNRDYNGDRAIIIEDGGNTIVNTIFSKTKKAPPGQGVFMLKREYDMAASLNVKRFTTFASGSWRDPYNNGYYTWPRCGYDRNLKETEIQDAEDSGFKGFTKVSDFMLDKASRDYWKHNGNDGDMVFNTDPNSLHSIILNEYIKELSRRNEEDPR